MQLRGGVLQPQARAQNAGAALPPKNKPDAGGIHEPHPAKVYDQGTRAAADQCIGQLHPQALGGIDILVNCAGVFPQALIEDITDEDWSRVMRINLDGAFYACRAAAPYLKKSGKNGRIINLSSQAALTGTAHGVHYGASKAARPFNSRLDKSKLAENGFTPLPDWKDALSRYLKERGTNP